MRCRLEIEQLESRDTPSVTFGGATGYDGVPFDRLITPGQGVYPWPNSIGEETSGIAIAINNGDVWGAPAVLEPKV